MKRTFFHEGHIPHNTKHDGYISTRGQYKWIRISKNNWMQLHRYIWEQHNGVIPPGANIVFKDGNSLNCEIENLQMVSNQNLMKDNSIMNYPEELRSTMRAVGQLKRTIWNYGKKQD